ncbi:hypothetical protein F5883DRAFT_16982 [Diaporthe sp. PMI_573]|nr:hypothetical protein F5883DRAFT_16982 [Diaporthaceae sp. PMI_573]
MNPKATEIWDQGDDWSGVASSKERRRRQNRLHQRAYRAKKRLEKFPSSQPGTQQGSLAISSPSAPITTDEDLLHALPRQHLSQLPIATPDLPPILLLIRCTDLHDKIKEFLQRIFTHWGLNLPTPHDLPLVTRLTTFDALARNALMLRIPLEYLETDEHSSLFNHQGPPRPVAEQPSLPTDLRPTALQKTVTHHSWLDLFPIPRMRDNILRGIESGAYDEDVLCDTLCCDLLKFDNDTNAALVVWGESWDAAGWEFCAEFFAKWGVLLQGCTEVLETTNYWRQKRGARILEYKLN